MTNGASHYDAVLSFHMNPLGCGVAKVNHALAKRLGVPCLPLGSACNYPLISVKTSELPKEVGLWSPSPCDVLLETPRPFDVLLHDRPVEWPVWLERAERIFYAEELGCPSTLSGHALRRGEIHLLTFGMAHKRCLSHFERLKMLLDQCGRSYTVGVSSAIHEGSPWAETWAVSDAALRCLFGDHFRQYGFLADDGLVNAIDDANVIALFYEPAARANNTTLWAAMERARVVITNLDAHSPQELVHGETVYDIALLEAWPEQTVGIRWAGQRLANGRYGWDALIAQLAPAAIASMTR